MIQTSFFPQPEKDKPIKIIKINPSGLQPKKLEEILPDAKIVPDTYIIHPTGGYHPFYGVPNTFPRYQLPIWPYIKRIKFSEYFSSEERLNNVRRNSLSPTQHLSQLNPTFHRGYFILCLERVGRYQTSPDSKVGARMTVKKRNVTMHRVVAQAWIPNSNPKKFNMVMHINDDPTNYLPENLKWGNASMNSIGNKKHQDTPEQRYLDLVYKGVIKG